MINEELVKMARLAQRDDRMATGALYSDLADRIETLIVEKKYLLERVMEQDDRVEALTADLARSTRLISKMVPLSACGNYVFWDGVGDIELDHNGELRNRIEALTAERDEHWKSFVHWRKEADALTEQLEAARADAKEAEAYAEELALDQVDLCRQLIAAEDKLAKAVEALRDMCTEFRDHDLPYGSKAYLKATTTLAEIDGGKP